MIKKTRNILEKCTMHIVFLAFLLFEIWNVWKYKIYVQSDDFGYLANAAFFAGYNWNPYTGDVTPYYNPGFSIFSSFIFIVFESPIVIYRISLLYIVTLLILSMIIGYNLIKRLGGLSNKKLGLLVFGYGLGMMAPQNGLYFLAEVPFALSYLLVVYLLIITMDSEGKKKKLLSIITAFILAYSYSVHTRFLITCSCIILVMLFYKIVYKKNIVCNLSFAISFILSFILTKKFIEYVQSTLYVSNTGKFVTGNDALTRLSYLEAYLKVFFNLENLEKIFLNFGSLMGSYTILTGGMIWIILSLIIVHFLENLAKVNKTRLDIDEQIITILGLTSFLLMTILIAINGTINANELKWLTYYRYGKPFMGLLFLLGIKILMDRKVNIRKVLIIAFCGVACSLLVINFYAAPILQSSLVEDVSEVGWFKYYFYSGQNATDYFFRYSHYVLILFIGFVYLIFKKKECKMIVMFILYSLLLTHSENTYNRNISQLNYLMVDNTRECVKELSTENTANIYFLQGSYSGKLRYVLYDVKMTFLISAENINQIDFYNSILLTDRTDFMGNIVNQPKYCIFLGVHEYLFTSDSETYKELQNKYDVEILNKNKRFVK